MHDKLCIFWSPQNDHGTLTIQQALLRQFRSFADADPDASDFVEHSRVRLIQLMHQARRL